LDTTLAYRLEPMTTADVPEVSRVERRCFSNPWPAAAYRRELRLPEQNAYVVLRQFPAGVPAVGPTGGPKPLGNGAHANGRHDGTRPLARLALLPFGRRPEPNAPRIVGFAGMWSMFDEAHITTIGVEPEFRGRGLGELLLIALADEAVRRGADWLTLEVRVSNIPAQALYRKYGFTVQGVRKRYYSDNNEDAYIMWSPSLRDPAYLARYAELRDRVLERFPDSGLPATVPRLGDRARVEGHGAAS
jgi:[ribosomal protein S18]-alanine N-acetyltransferase